MCFGAPDFKTFPLLCLQHSEEGNLSVSVLSFVPGIDDDGKYLTCRAENPEINDSALEDRWRLNVHCEY
jgi:hypothetical protein